MLTASACHKHCTAKACLLGLFSTGVTLQSKLCILNDSAGALEAAATARGCSSHHSAICKDARHSRPAQLTSCAAVQTGASAQAGLAAAATVA